MAHDSGTLDPNGDPQAGAPPRDFFRQATAFARGKTSEPVLTPLPKAAAPKKGSNGAPPSIISINVEMGGQIVSPQELHIYGAIEGDVRATSLVICTGGVVRGEVVADSVTVHGTVDGRIHGQSVQICAGGIVRGDIVHSELGVEKGGVFEGASKRVQDPMAGAPTIVVKKKADQGAAS